MQPIIGSIVNGANTAHIVYMWTLSILTDRNTSQEKYMFLHWHRMDCTQLKGTTKMICGATVNMYAIAQLKLHNNHTFFCDLQTAIVFVSYKVMHS